MGNTATSALSAREKIAEAMRRSLPHLPEGARSIVSAMLRPESIALITGTTVVWAGSHFFGVGEVVDAVLLLAGVVTLGFAVFEGADQLYQFATIALGAQTEAELE